MLIKHSLLCQVIKCSRTRLNKASLLLGSTETSSRNIEVCPNVPSAPCLTPGPILPADLWQESVTYDGPGAPCKTQLLTQLNETFLLIASLLIYFGGGNPIRLNHGCLSPILSTSPPLALPTLRPHSLHTCLLLSSLLISPNRQGKQAYTHTDLRAQHASWNPWCTHTYTHLYLD